MLYIDVFVPFLCVFSLFGVAISRSGQRIFGVYPKCIAGDSYCMNARMVLKHGQRVEPSELLFRVKASTLHREGSHIFWKREETKMSRGPRRSSFMYLKVATRHGFRSHHVSSKAFKKPSQSDQKRSSDFKNRFQGTQNELRGSENTFTRPKTIARVQKMISKGQKGCLEVLE